MINKMTICTALNAFSVPGLSKNWASERMVKHFDVADGLLSLTVRLGFPIDSIKDEFIAGLQQALQAWFNVKQVQLVLQTRVRAHQVHAPLKPYANIKNIIAIASGKGGVGKSTTAVNVACALQQAGARVGLLDADIYGPNQPAMLGATEKPELTEDKKLKPLMRYGLQTMSIGYLVDNSTPMVWRGPMVTSALKQLLHDTLWEDLDYLIIDLPPGTGDIQLTLAKSVPVTAAVMVTTPQLIAMLDVRKGIEMFSKVNVPILGIVENMSGHTCSSCGHQTALFGEGAGEQLAEACGVPLLCQIPLVQAIREQADCGKPLVLAQPESVVACEYKTLALRITAEIAAFPIDYQSKFANIAVE